MCSEQVCWTTTTTARVAPTERIHIFSYFIQQRLGSYSFFFFSKLIRCCKRKEKEKEKRKRNTLACGMMKKHGTSERMESQMEGADAS